MSDRSIRAQVEAAAGRLAAAGVPGARAEAELLLGRVIGVGRAGLVARRDDDLDDHAAGRFETWVARRCRREPFQHLTRTQEFRGLPFQVGPEALVPRPETEDVVQAVLDASVPHGGRVVDLGTGSGCIAAALATERPDLALAALDLSAPALTLARKNADCLGVAARIEFVLGSMTDPPERWLGRFDAVVSNPPYVSEDEWRRLDPEVRDHEPKLALVPGPTGAEMYRALAPVARSLLRGRGPLVLELGHESEPAAREAVQAAGFRVDRVRPDFQGIPRVMVAVLA